MKSFVISINNLYINKILGILWMIKCVFIKHSQGKITYKEQSKYLDTVRNNCAL